MSNHGQPLVLRQPKYRATLMLRHAATLSLFSKF
jgi:hypothetical protein